MAGSEIRQRLKVYRAIDNDVRLNALSVIANDSDIAFNDLAKKVGVETGLLAYHIGVLKSVGLVESAYVRRSKKTSKYRLSEEGKRILKEFGLVGSTRPEKRKN